MATQGNYTSSGSKSRDTRGSEPSQDDVREKLRSTVEDDRDVTGLSGDSAGEESLDTGGEAGLGSTGVRGQRGTPGRDRHL